MQSLCSVALSHSNFKESGDYMADYKKLDHTKTIDVVADANYSTLSKEYSRMFRDWRSNENNDYAFHCRRTAGENIYVEGVGYQSPNPAAEERRAMLQINMAIGFGMLVYLLLENLFIYLLISAVQFFGIDICYSYSDKTVYGGETAVLVILMIQTFIKYLIPILIFRRLFRVPRRVAFHLKLDAPREFPVSICITLIVFAIVNMWILFSPANLLSSSTLGTAYYAVSYMRPAYQFIYLGYELVVVSIMSELLLHGEMFHVLRQFGDWYAILMTAVLGVCMTHSYVTLLMDLTFAVIVGISVFRSGSLLPAFFDRMLYHILLFSFFWLKVIPNRKMADHQPLLMFLILFVGIIGCLIFIRPRKNDPALLQQKHYLSTKERFAVIVHLGPLSIIFILCIALMLIEVIFK